MKRVRQLSLLGLASLQLIAAGCSKDVDQQLISDSGNQVLNSGGGNTTPTTKSETERFNQQAPVTKLDILFMADTSSSLDDERQKIAQEIDKAIGALSPLANVDFRIGVMVAHSSSARAGKLYRRGTEPLVLTSQMTTAQIKTHLNYKLTSMPDDPTTDGGEAGLYSLTQAFTSANMTANKGTDQFFRAGAGLAVVFISDEDDICASFLPKSDPKELTAFNQFCKNPEVTPLTVRTLLNRQQGTLPLIVAGIIYTGAKPVPVSGENSIGHGTQELVQLTGGLPLDLADPNVIGDGLEKIAEKATEDLSVQKNFPLKQSKVVGSSIKVTVDGQSRTFSYNEVDNIVTVHQPGNFGSLVEITYDYQI